MLVLGLAAGLCLLTLAGLSRGVTSGGRLVWVGFDGVGVLGGFVVTVFAATVFGPINGLSVLLALLLHEAGHVLGARLAGRETAEFRLLPAIGGLCPDDSGISRDLGRLVQALMGAGLSVGFLVLAFALSRMLPGAGGSFFRALTISIALVNALNLMPFRPLDGGRCIDLIARSLSPSVRYLAAASAIAGLSLLGLYGGLVWLICFAALGLVMVALRPQGPERTQPMEPREAGLGFLAYLAVLGTHVAGGWVVLVG